MLGTTRPLVEYIRGTQLPEGCGPDVSTERFSGHNLPGRYISYSVHSDTPAVLWKFSPHPSCEMKPFVRV